MIKYLLAQLLIFTVIHSSAQFTENFGTLTGQEIDLKTCAFDSTADAAILLHEASTYYDDTYRMITYHHIRKKILTKRGMEHANVSIKFYSGDEFEYVNDITAMTINAAQSHQRIEIPVDKKSIYYKKINAYYSEVTFAFPGVQVGSILEYSYRSTMKHYGGLEEWNFQTELPVYKSSYLLKTAPNLGLTYAVQRASDYPVKIELTEREGVVYFEMKNIPGLDKEPYMDSREDYLQKIRFQITQIVGYGGARNYMSSWNEVARELGTSGDYGHQLKVSVPDEQKLFISGLNGRSDKEKMKAIYDYMRQNYQWNHYTSRNAGGGIEIIIYKKTGTSGAINFALINMLQEAKLEVYPMLVSERGNGNIDTRSPFVQQFNGTYAAVFIDGNPYYLNATDLYTPAYLTPESILNTTALLLKKNTGVITTIKEERYKYVSMVSINTDLASDGTMIGNVQTYRSNYARTERMRHYSPDNKMNINYLKKDLLNIIIDSLQMANTDIDTLPLEENFNYKTGIPNTGGYAFLDAAMFTGFKINPFISDRRFSNINFGFRHSIILNHTIAIPSDVIVDGLPKNLRLTNADRSISFIRELVVHPELSLIQARIKIDLEKSLYSVEEYPELKEFFKRMTDFLNEQIVLKKK